MVKWLIFFSSLLLSVVSYSQMGRHSTSDELTGQELALILKSARAVLTELNESEMETNPGTTGIDLIGVEAQIAKRYLNLTGKRLEYTTTPGKMMQKAIRLSLEKAYADKYKDVWAKEKHYPNKLLPARFAREVGINLKDISNGQYDIRVSTVDSCLVNKKNKADEWERKQITEKLSTKSWVRTRGVYENLPLQKVDRYIIPEYYEQRCLTCHGGAAGQALHPNCPFRDLGGFGGVISVVMKYNSRGGN